MRVSRGVEGDLENHKGIGFFRNTGPDPLENHKATKSTINRLGHHQLANETPLRWSFARNQMMHHSRCQQNEWFIVIQV